MEDTASQSRQGNPAQPSEPVFLLGKQVPCPWQSSLVRVVVSTAEWE